MLHGFAISPAINSNKTPSSHTDTYIHLIHALERLQPPAPPGRASAVRYPVFACLVCQSDSGVSSLTSVLENMCGQGSTVGGKFSELRGIIDKVRDQTRVGVCLDTCHAFAAGESVKYKES